MKPLSRTTSLLIERLYREIRKDAHAACETLAEIVERGEVAAVPSLLSVVVMVRPFCKDEVPRTVVEGAAAAVATLMARATPQCMARLEQDLRARSPYLSAWAWLGQGPWTSAWEEPWALVGRERALLAATVADDVDVLEFLGEATPVLLGLATFHPNGYVREEALRRLDARHRMGRDGGMLVPCLLLRVNDWVEPLRVLASAMLEERLDLATAPVLLRYIGLVQRLGQSGRDDHSRLLDTIHHLLGSEAARPYLVAVLRAPLVEVRRYAWRTLLRGAGDLGQVLRQGLCDSDPVIRRAVAERMCAEPDADRLRGFLELLRRDPSPRIRAQAVTTAGERVPEDARKCQEAALLDRDVRVREAGRSLAKRSGASGGSGLVTDFPAFYRRHVDIPGSERILEGALLGLGDTGNRQDALVGGRHLGHPSPRVRRAAILAVGRLAPEAYLEDLLEALGDPQGSVSRAARQALLPWASVVGAPALWAYFSHERAQHTRRNALVLLARAGKWASIRYLLPASLEPDAWLSSRARAEIERWIRLYNRRQVPPSAAELDDVVRCLCLEADRLPEGTVRFLESVLADLSRRGR